MIVLHGHAVQLVSFRCQRLPLSDFLQIGMLHALFV